MVEDEHELFALIFMDNEMPEMSGLESIQHIRKFEEEGNLVKIPIVMVSGH